MGTKNKMIHSPQRGSALVYVFVGIALFGILMFVFSRGGNQNTASLTKQQAKTKAVEIMNRADAIARSVDKLVANGCSITQLNFYSSHFTQSGTTNPNAPPDGSCDVYSPSGGKLKWEACPDSTLCPDPYLYAPMTPRSLVVNSVGDNPEDLVYLVLVRKEVCLAINSMLGLPITDLPATHVDGGPYIGVFSKDNALPRIASGGDYTPFIGKTAGCMYAGNYMIAWGGEFFFYYRVLLAL
jgi:hypothetical protein